MPLSQSDQNATFPYYMIVPAAGVGRRMGTAQPKQYLPLNGRTVLECTLEALLEDPCLHQLVLVVDPLDQRWRSLPIINDPRIIAVDGGKERCYSVYNGLRYLADSCDDDDWVLVHDVARPCINADMMQNLLQQLRADRVGGILAIPVSDTIKQVNELGVITATLPRAQLWQAQTPQMFRYKLLVNALQAAIDSGVIITDEAAAIELAGLAPKVVAGCPQNIKITLPQDLALAQFYLSARSSEDK